MEDDSLLYKVIDEKPLRMGLSLDLVEKESTNLTDNFICAVCLNLVLDPIFCEESDCVFCKICIDAWNTKDKKCPNCRHEFKPNCRVSRIVKNVLYKVKLKCLFFSSGCKEIVEYEKYETHLKECDFIQCKCLIKGCDFEGIRKEIKLHIKSCSFRESPCEFCSITIKKNIILEHYLSCEKFPKYCPVCKQNIQNKELGSHNKGSCFDTLSKSFLSAAQTNEILNTQFYEDLEHTKSSNSIMEQKLRLYEKEIADLKNDNAHKSKKIDELCQDIMKIKSSNLNLNSNVGSSGQNPGRNTINLGSVGPSVQMLCLNNLHNFEFLRQGISTACSKCKREISCRFKCKLCKSHFCYRCNLPSEKNKCPHGHSMVRLKRDLPFYCDMCFDFFDEGTFSNCDKDCDVDICDKCYKSKDCLIF